MNDINFIKEIAAFKTVSKVTSLAGLAAIKRHLWYLSEELVVLALFSNKVPLETKVKIQLKLLSVTSNKTFKLVGNNKKYKCKSSEIMEEKSLEDFIGNHSYALFDLLEISRAFLRTPVETWNQNQEYIEAKALVNTLSVVNDPAERAIGLAKEFNSSITTNENQKQYLYHQVFDNRIIFNLNSTIFNLNKKRVT